MAAALVVDLLRAAGSGGDLDAPARRRSPGAGARTARRHPRGGAGRSARELDVTGTSVRAGGGPRSTAARPGGRARPGHPGLDFSRADAVRSLLTRALDQIEGPSAPTKRGGR